MDFNLEISGVFPASRIGKPCYVELLTRDGSQLYIRRMRPVFPYIANLISGEVFNSEQIFFEQFHAEDDRQYTVTHVALYEDPFCWVPFTTAPLTSEINISHGVVAAIDAGAVTFVLARGL